jgi:8-amino-7-oxononanoate synthase
MFAGVIYTFGKAVGVHGAALLTNYEEVVSHLLNYSYPLIYSTSLPSHTLISVLCAYDHMRQAQAERDHLKELIIHFKNECIRLHLDHLMIESPSAIQGP